MSVGSPSYRPPNHSLRGPHARPSSDSMKPPEQLKMVQCPFEQMTSSTLGRLVQSVPMTSVVVFVA